MRKLVDAKKTEKNQQETSAAPKNGPTKLDRVGINK